MAEGGVPILGADSVVGGGLGSGKASSASDPTTGSLGGLDNSAFGGSANGGTAFDNFGDPVGSYGSFGGDPTGSFGATTAMTNSFGGFGGDDSTSSPAGDIGGTQSGDQTGSGVYNQATPQQQAAAGITPASMPQAPTNANVLPPTAPAPDPEAFTPNDPNAPAGPAGYQTVTTTNQAGTSLPGDQSAINPAAGSRVGGAFTAAGIPQQEMVAPTPSNTYTMMNTQPTMAAMAAQTPSGYPSWLATAANPDQIGTGDFPGSSTAAAPAAAPAAPAAANQTAGPAVPVSGGTTPSPMNAGGATAVAMDPATSSLMAGSNPDTSDPVTAAAQGGQQDNTGFTPGQWYQDPQGEWAQYKGSGQWVDANGNPMQQTNYGTPRGGPPGQGGNGAGGGQGGGGGGGLGSLQGIVSQFLQIITGGRGGSPQLNAMANSIARMMMQQGLGPYGGPAYPGGGIGAESGIPGAPWNPPNQPAPTGTTTPDDQMNSPYSGPGNKPGDQPTTAPVGPSMEVTPVSPGLAAQGAGRTGPPFSTIPPGTFSGTPTAASAAPGSAAAKNAVNADVDAITQGMRNANPNDPTIPGNASPADGTQQWLRSMQSGSGRPTTNRPPSQADDTGAKPVPDARRAALGQQNNSGVPARVLQGARTAAMQGGPAAVARWMANNGHPKYGNWCGEFAAAVMQHEGLPVPRHPEVASNWRTWGQATNNPKPGDVAVRRNNYRTGAFVPTGQLGSHVTMVESVNPANRTMTIIGGDQGRMLETVPLTGYDFRTLRGAQAAQGYQQYQSVPVQP